MELIMDSQELPISSNSQNISSHIPRRTSLSTLVVWNISKALEKSPSLNLKEAVLAAQNRLDQISGLLDMQSKVSDSPHERHLACALLAWQQLGHKDAESLCRFVENKAKMQESPLMRSTDELIGMKMQESPLIRSTDELISIDRIRHNFTQSNMNTKTSSPSSMCRRSREKEEEAKEFYNVNSFCTMGPVVKLPAEAKVVMRLDNTTRARRPSPSVKKPRAPESDTIRKIDQACCLDSVCVQSLAAMDATSAELRARVSTLARREADRVELLERAEAAWRDLELGYQRRLGLTQEKEEDVAKQITKMLEERIAYKNVCTTLEKELKERTGQAEIERISLMDMEKQVCERACQRMRLSEESAKGDAQAAELSSKIAQLDRDLQFKEELLRRTLQNLRGELSALRTLASEGERATRCELGALGEQIAVVSKKLLEEDALNAVTMVELEDLREEKTELVEDLDGCKELCDGQMQGRMNYLTEKREHLEKLREKVMECRCKMPVDIAVEVKRTPSLAALCKCSPEDKILECCSCTSMRTKLLSNLFVDLFGGLQHELGGAVAMMPCQLLKCLEDKHNWDRASVVKTNLKNYFSGLLVGELDIAIATSIENYHVKWVGESCADAAKMRPGPQDDPEREGWEQRAVERRAQQLAEKLAEQLFQERADELTQRARDILNAGPPPCECDLKAKLAESCGTKRSQTPASQPEPETKVYWHQATQDVTQLRVQVDDFRKINSPPDRDINNGMDRKLTKKSIGNTPHYRNIKRNIEPVKTLSFKENVICSSLAKQNTICANQPTPHIPFSWQQALKDVALLRLQIEDLKKESIKKEDLKMMEDKITKIVNRASGNAASINSKLKNNPVENYGNANKNLKINRAIQSKFQKDAFSEIDKSATIKTFGSVTREIKSKFSLSRGVNKPYKKVNPAYAVNMCLCSTKLQAQNELNEKRKLRIKSKDVISQMSSSFSKPINNSFLLGDITSQSYSEDINQQPCPTDCVCFHKIPSNKSLDKLLETLAKWKGDLDASCTEKKSVNMLGGNLSASNYKCSLGRDSLEYKTSLKSNSKEISLQKRINSTIPRGNLEQLSQESFNKMSPKFTGAFATDSVYMGAVNLDKSQEEICDCKKVVKKLKTTFHCIDSSNCNCVKILETNTNESIKSESKSENQEEINMFREQEPKTKQIIVIPKQQDITKNKMTPDALSPENEFTSNVTTKPVDFRAHKMSDYQINFLGVTLVDVSPVSKNEILDHSSNYELNKNNKKLAETRKIIHEIRHDNPNYLGDINHAVSHVTDDIKTINTDIISTNDALMKNSNCFVIDDKKSNDACQIIYYDNTNNKEYKYNTNNKEHKYNTNNKEYNKYKYVTKLNCTEQLNTTELYINTKNKNSDFAYKTVSEQNASNLYCDNNQIQMHVNEIIAHTKNSHESEISKKTFKTAFESIQIFDGSLEKADCQENLAKENIQKDTLKLSQRSNHSNRQMISCECKMVLDEFKKIVNANLRKESNIKDIALDVQSWKHSKGRAESCVCCSKLNDLCRDLEDNAFHLLEEYLKKKFDKLKASTRLNETFTIPTEEEEKFFSVIVQRVKRLISESTNQLANTKIEKKPEGSWDRAYGLLQEYLKIKIKKVQCSCLLAEDNKDTILPDVLEKISNLIEYDFQRLKNICRYPNDQNNSNKPCDGLHVNLKNQNKVSTTNLLKFSPLEDQFSLSCYQTNQDKKSNQIIKSKQPLILPEKKEHCILRGKNDRHCNVSPSINTIQKLFDYNRTSISKESSEKASKELENMNISSNATSHFQMSNYFAESVKEVKPLLKKSTSLLHEKRNQNINSYDNNELRSCDSNVDTRLISKNSKLDCNKSSSSKVYCHKSTASMSFCEAPYFGYTISCSCDKTLGLCICPKNGLSTDFQMANYISQKMVPEKKTIEKFSYILSKKPDKNVNTNIDLLVSTKISNSSNILTNNFLKSETTFCNKLEPMVLKTSICDISIGHAETNTCIDNVNINTECSHNKNMDWSECSSNSNLSKNIASDRVQRSMYFPAQIENYDEKPRCDTLDGDTSTLWQQYVCECEKIPICHVKMLVQNIETKLANANCTCDSLTPKVCPVHSNMC